MQCIGYGNIAKLWNISKKIVRKKFSNNFSMKFSIKTIEDGTYWTNEVI